MRLTSLILLLSFVSCNSVTTTKQKVIVYDTIYRDTTIYRYKDSIVFIPTYIPEYLKEAIKNGTVKYTIDIK